MYKASISKGSNISDIQELLLDDDELLCPVQASQLRKIEHQRLRCFCDFHGFYSIPSLELIEGLKDLIGNPGDALEIGAGNGVYGRHLGIRSTDSYMQHPKNRAKFRNTLSLFEQSEVPPVDYGSNVIEMNGVDAVRKFKPKVVFGAWVTHRYNPIEQWRGGNMFGVNFPWILDRRGVERLILVGNDVVHANNPIMELPHKKLDFDGAIFSRAQDNTKNFVYVWDC